MKGKILAIGMVSMLLLLGVASFSAIAKETDVSVDSEKSVYSLGDDFSISIRGGLFGVHITVRSLSGETGMGEYSVIFDFKQDRKDYTSSGSFTAGPNNDGDIDCSNSQFGIGRVDVTVSIDGQTAEKHGFCYGLLCYTILF